MRKMRRRAAWSLAAATLLACGSRSGLLEGVPSSEIDPNPPLHDAGQEASVDAADDVVADAHAEDVVVDGLAPCDPLDLFIYLVTEQKDLYRYDPGVGSITLVGQLSCPEKFGSPFSMGVSRSGTAYVLYSTLAAPGVTAPGKLFAVDIEDASCSPTSFEPGQFDFDLFGMGFALDDDGMGETLYVASIKWGEPSLGLAAIDLDSFVLQPIGPFSTPMEHGMELTSSDDGQLYAYALGTSSSGGAIVRVDKHTAQILETTPLPVGTESSALAFAYWGGDFYMFTSPTGTTQTTITRYSPVSKTTTVVGTLAKTVVGAGVTTCKAK